jgi:hypothetical protein
VELVRCLVGTGTLALLALAGSLGAVRLPVLAAVDPPWQPPPCGSVRAGGSLPGSSPAAWYRLDPVLDTGGSLVGQRLTLGLVDGPARHLDLPAEAFASGPTSGVVLVGEDDGSVSRLRSLDVIRGCASLIGTERGLVIRGAVLEADGSVAWEHRVNRATRADEGVWRRSLDTGEAVRVLAGLPRDDAFGPTFVTELSIAADGRLAVASCGQRACRTRLLEPDSGFVAAFSGTGPLVGVHGNTAVVLGACSGLPCPLEAVDTRTGHRDILVADAGLAAMSANADGTLVFESGDGSLASLDLDTGRTTALLADTGLLPMRRTSSATSGADTPAGSVLLAPAGRVGQASSARSLDLRTNRTTDLKEVLP